MMHNRVYLGRISRKALVVIATLTGISSIALAISLPYRQDFEATPVGTIPDDISYLTGDVGVEDTSATGGSKLLHLRSGSAPDVIGYDVSAAATGVYWLEFKIKPQATAAPLPFVDIDGAKFSLKTDTTGYAKLQVWNDGAWIPVGARIATDTNGLATTFARVAIRVDYATRRFHVFLDGALVASDLLLDSATITAPHSLEFYFDDVSEVFLDDLSLAANIPVGSFVDSDGDGLSDADEINRGTNPFSSDTDGDGIPDGWEVASGLNPLSISDAQFDPDGDGLTNAQEYAHGANPLVSDTDGDGVNDGAEVAAGRNPLAPDDTDGDGLTDMEEPALGADPSKADTDPAKADTDSDGQDDSYGADGLAVVERWTGFSTLPALADFRVSPAVNYPAGSGLGKTRAILKNLAISGASVSGGAVERVRGWITAPVTGNFTFTLLQEAGAANGNEAHFLLSSDDTAASLSERTSVIPVSGVGSSSVTLPLVAGQRYYYEIWTRKADASADTRLDWVRPSTNP